MNDENKTATPESGNKLGERAAKLSTRGAHFFVGWLISSGKHIPEVAAEFDRALHHLEIDPTLHYCWRENGQPEKAPTSVGPSAPPHMDEQPANPANPFHILTDQIQPQEQSASEVAQLETAPACSSLAPTGLFARLFRKERVAA